MSSHSPETLTFGPFTLGELLARVWPDVVVGEGSLRFHVASLRKALGDGIGGARYITTVAGRGYCFVAPVVRSGKHESARPPVVSARVELPSRLLRMVGRAEEIRQLVQQLRAGRFVTIVGSGGVGKTTVAGAVAHDFAAEFHGVVLFVDLGSIGPLHMFHFRRGEYRTSLEYAQRSAAATSAGDPEASAVARGLTGISLHMMGELSSARSELEASLHYGPVSYRSRILHLGFDYYNWAGMALGRTLWMQGHPEEAVARVCQTIENAEQLDHPVTLSMALHWAAALYLWQGDLDAAETHIDWFLSRAETHSLGPYLAVGRGLKGELAIRRGNPQQGVELLESALLRLRVARYKLEHGILPGTRAGPGRPRAARRGAEGYRLGLAGGRCQRGLLLHAGTPARKEPAAAEHRSTARPGCRGVLLAAIAGVVTPAVGSGVGAARRG